MGKTQVNTKNIKTTKEIMNFWRAQSKAGKALRILNTISPIFLSSLLFISFLTSFLSVLYNEAQGNSVSPEVFLTDLLMLIAALPILSFPFGIATGLLSIFSRISIGKYVNKNSIDVRKILRSEQKTRKKDEIEISIGLWTYEKPKSNILLFVRFGIWFVSCFAMYPFFYMAVRLLCDFIRYHQTNIINAILSSSSLVVLFIISSIFYLALAILERVAQNKAKDNLYSRD